MKTHAFLTLILSLALLCPRAYSQDYVPTPVTVSKDKVKVDGKLYYSHIVLERQTLYSICKAYGVTAEEVYAANPTLRETGLRKNAIILVPAVSAGATSKSAADRHAGAATDATAGEATGATAAKGTAGAAVAENSTAAEKRSTKAADERKASKKEAEKYTVHTVKWYEDIDMIANKYGVSVENIMAANNLIDRKLSKRQKLRIPLSGAASASFSDEKAGQEAAGDARASGSRDKEQTEGVAGRLFGGRTQDSEAAEVKEEIPLYIKRKVDAVLMLPFNAAATKPNEGSIDYYCGALMALKDLGNQGIDIDFSVYDVADGNLHVTEDRLRKSDVVIGPVSTADITRLLQVAPSTTPIVSPLDHRTESLTQSYPNLIQAPSSTKAQYRDLLNWIIEDKGESDPVIVIHEKGYNISGDDTALGDILRESGLEYKPFSYSILEGRQITDSLKNLMNPETDNRVLILSESEAFVNDVVRNLNLMIHEKYNLTLYGTSRIRSFETIEVDNLHNVKLHTSVAYHIDYESDAVRQFIMQYRALYNTEPTPYAYQGYDTVMFIVKTCSESYKSLIETLEGKEGKMLQTNFKFERGSENQGLVNNAVRRVVYGDDYTISLF